MQFIELKNAIRQKFTWPGGYEIFGITSDGAALCCDCMKKEFKQIAWSIVKNVNDGWKVVTVDNMSNCEPDSITCDHCNKTL